MKRVIDEAQFSNLEYLNPQELPTLSSEIVKVLKKLLETGLTQPPCDCGEGINANIIQAMIEKLEKEVQELKIN